MSTQTQEITLEASAYIPSTTYSQSPEYAVGTIIDIGGSKLSETMKDWLEERLFNVRGHQLEKSDGTIQHLLPSPLLSNDIGLDMWRQVNRMPHYYQTCDEVELFERYGEEIARSIPDGASLVDLGSGDVRKIKPLLDTLETSKKRIRYFALDLSRKSLENIMQQIGSRYKYIQCHALWGLFHEGREWIQNIPSPRWICSLGSSLGNDWFTPAVKNLHQWSSALNMSDRILLGMDSCKDREVVWRSYHDPDKLFEQFIRNGLEHSESVMGEKWYDPADWGLRGIFCDQPFMHYFAFVAKKDVLCRTLGVTLKKGTQIDCYEAFKYSPEEMSVQFKASNLQQLSSWTSSSGKIVQYLLAPISQQASK